MVCVTLRPSTPSYGYSQQCGGRSASRVESRGADRSTNSQTSAWLGPSARTRAGPWHDLFSTGDGYLGTELLRASSGSGYLTVDRWDHRNSFDAFMSARTHDYRALDQRLEGIAVAERRIGDFDTVG